MPKPRVITLGEHRSEIEIPILYDDRSVLAIDKPAGWLLAPSDWDRTERNLQLAIASSIRGGDFWAASRNLKFLRFVHRLDAETTGVLLFAKSGGSVSVYSRMFEDRQMRKLYWAVIAGKPPREKWTERGPIGPDPRQPGKMRIDPRQGKEAETEFELLANREERSLIAARPLTGRTHQIRVHLANAGCPVIGDAMYGGPAAPKSAREFPLALRALELSYRDPFTRHEISIRAPSREFASVYGVEPGIKRPS